MCFSFFILKKVLKMILKSIKNNTKASIMLSVRDKELNMREIEKARAILLSSHLTFNQLHEITKIPVPTLKRYSRQAKDKASFGKYENIAKLAKVYDKSKFEDQKRQIDLTKAMELGEWLKNNIPNDTWGKRIKKAIMNDSEVLIKILQTNEK